MVVQVQQETFDPGLELNHFIATHSGLGAVVSFTGITRDFSDDHSVTALTLEHYPGMTEKVLRQLSDHAVQRFAIEKTLIIHRYGRLVPSEVIVMVIAGGAHRSDCFDACQFLIDRLKTDAPFWKLEERGEQKVWLEAKMTDDQKSSGWKGNL